MESRKIFVLVPETIEASATAEVRVDVNIVARNMQRLTAGERLVAVHDNSCG